MTIRCRTIFHWWFEGDLCEAMACRVASLLLLFFCVTLQECIMNTPYTHQHLSVVKKHPPATLRSPFSYFRTKLPWSEWSRWSREAGESGGSEGADCLGPSLCVSNACLVRVQYCLVQLKSRVLKNPLQDFGGPFGVCGVSVVLLGRRGWAGGDGCCQYCEFGPRLTDIDFGSKISTRFSFKRVVFARLKEG